MAAYGQGSRSRLSYVVESAFGTTPGGPTMLSLPFNTHSLDLVKQRVQGNEIQPDRMPRVDRHGNRNGQGDITVDLRATDFDELLESAFLDTFGTSGADNLVIGTTPQYLTIEDAQLDLGTPQYRRFTGMTVSQMSVNIAPNQMVQATFSMVGQDMSMETSSLGTPTASSGSEPFDSYSGSISEGGSSIAIVTGLQFTLTNSFAPAFAVGSATAAQLELGRAVVEGQVTAYFEDAALINKFLNETESSISVTLDDTTSGETYTFLLPRVKYNGASVPVQNEQSRIITLPFVSLYDTSEATNLKLTRSA